MSVSAISASNSSDYSSTFQQLKQELQQLGTDLTAGNLSAAQSDFVTLQQDLPQSSSSSSSTSNPIEQAFNQLSQDLQAGNLTAAQQDYATIQTDMQNKASQGTESAEGTEGAGRHHHHHGDSGSSSGSNGIGQLMSQLGQELKSGNLSGAQTTYNSLQQDFEQFSHNSGDQWQSSSQSTSSTVSVRA